MRFEADNDRPDVDDVFCNDVTYLTCHLWNIYSVVCVSDMWICGGHLKEESSGLVSVRNIFLPIRMFGKKIMLTFISLVFPPILR